MNLGAFKIGSRACTALYHETRNTPGVSSTIVLAWWLGFGFFPPALWLRVRSLVELPSVRHPPPTLHDLPASVSRSANACVAYLTHDAYDANPNSMANPLYEILPRGLERVQRRIDVHAGRNLYEQAGAGRLRRRGCRVCEWTCTTAVLRSARIAAVPVPGS